MNLIRFQLKCLLNVSKTAVQITRNCTQYINYPEKWVRPKQICCVEPEKSGDGGLDFNINENDFIRNYEKSKELANADENIKKLFSVGFRRKKELISLQMDKALKSVQRHSHDIGSTEAKIATATVEILRLQAHYKHSPRDISGKVFLKELIEKRKKWLRKLRDLDYARFEFLLERLNLVYHPYPEEDLRLTTKFCQKRLHEHRCHQIIKKKLDAYKDELQAKQKKFFTDKVQKLEYIRNTEIECGVTPTVSEKQIEEAKAKAALYL